MIPVGKAQGSGHARLAWATRATLVAGGFASLAACSSVPDSLNPVAWVHHLQGGAIEQPRPPPPGATQPYPNLASVPDKPVATDPKLRAEIANSLVADRSNAQYVASQQPIADPSSPQASPHLFGAGTARPPAPAAQAEAPTAQAAAPAATASLVAADAPPPKPEPAGPAQPGSAPARANGSDTPSSAPPTGAAAAAGGPQSAASGSTPLAPTSQMTSAEPVAPETALPSLPATPPPSPNLPGAPAATPAPAPVPHPPPAAPVAAKPPGPPMGVAFPPGSAILPSGASASIKTLANQRGDGTILVVGYGEAATSDPSAQQKALALAVSRAQAVASVLATAGVPADHIQIDAQASGSGAAARVIN